MTERRVEFYPEAVSEARAALEWYQARSELAASAFIAELDLAVIHIGETPSQWPTYSAGTRRYLLQRFPYSVIYREVEGAVQVIAVAHGRRRPGYWKGRA